MAVILQLLLSFEHDDKWHCQMLHLELYNHFVIDCQIPNDRTEKSQQIPFLSEVEKRNITCSDFGFEGMNSVNP